MGNGGVKSKDMDRQGVLLNGSGNPEFSATSPTLLLCIPTLVRSFIHYLLIHSFETEPRCLTGLHGSQYGDKAGLELQRFASALSAGIKCMPPCLTSWGLQTVHLGDSFGLTTIIPRRGLHGALTLRLHSWVPCFFPFLLLRKSALVPESRPAPRSWGRSKA